MSENKGNKKIISAPLVTYYSTGFNRSETNLTKESLDLVDKIFDRLEEIESETKANEVWEFWLTANRGPIEDYGDFEEMLEYGIVKDREDYERQWEREFPNEEEWYTFTAVKSDNGYKLIMLQHRPIIEKAPKQQAGMHDFTDILWWILDGIDKVISKLKDGTYNDLIRNSLPYRLRTGTISRKDLWDIYPEEREEFYKEITREEVKEFIANVEQLNGGRKPIKPLANMTAGLFFECCALGYKECGYEGCDTLTPKELYKRYADGRDEGLSNIDENSPGAFDEWERTRQLGGHPWEIVRGGNSTHVSLQVYREGVGYIFVLAGLHRQSETIRFYNAIVRKGYPLVLNNADRLLAFVNETERIGIVPEGVIPRYCESMFPNQKVVNFFNLDEDEDQELIERAEWHVEKEIRLKGRK